MRYQACIKANISLPAEPLLNHEVLKTCGRKLEKTPLNGMANASSWSVITSLNIHSSFKVNHFGYPLILPCSKTSSPWKELKLRSSQIMAFNSNEFSPFAGQWRFTHLTSSPLYLQPNGYIEHYVRTFKSVWTMTKAAHIQLPIALLHLISTPLGPNLPSLTHIMHIQLTGTNLPESTNPDKIKSHLECLYRWAGSSNTAYDICRQARELPPLHIDHRMLHQVARED